MGKKDERGNLVNCPECEKPVSAQGFAGHMRWKHRIESNPKEIFKTVKDVAINAEKGVRLYELMDLLVECRARKEKVGEMLANVSIFPLFSREEDPAEALKRGLDAQEKDIRADLENLGWGEKREDS